jgi:UDP-N-acetyl-D-glucosamine dehydrogenase
MPAGGLGLLSVSQDPRSGVGMSAERERFFAEETWTAGVIGLGYVGLPLVVNAAQRGLRAIGFDVSEQIVQELRTGRSHVEDVSDTELKAAINDGLEITTDRERLAEADALFVCVPSPLGRNRQPDMTYIEAAAETIVAVARPGQLISLESTTYPGTTEDLLVPAVEAAGLELDRDVFVSFSPERVDPGNPMKTGEIPKVVGGVTADSGRVAVAAYQRLVSAVHPVPTARAAELTKLLENTYRAVNIALVNEMAQLAHELEINIWEVIDAADTKPFGFQAFYPGPGVGGHCIPLDPQYLAWRAREMKFATRFIDLADQINARMPDYVVWRIIDELNRMGRPLNGTPILAVGISYKPNLADDRESPALDVLRLLEGRGARIGVLDPFVPAERIEQRGYEAVPDDAPLVGWTMALILTDHDAVDYDEVARAAEVVFDTRAAYYRRNIVADNVVQL